MKMFIPKHNKVKRLLLLQLDAQVPEEEDQKSLQKLIQATLSNQKNQKLGMRVFMQPLQSAQMPIIKIKHPLCSPSTALPNHCLMLHRHWRIHILRNQRANNHFLIVLHRFGTNIYVFMLGNWKGIVMKLIILLLLQQFNILRKNMREMNFPLTLKAKMMIAFPSIRTLQRLPSCRIFFLEASIRSSTMSLTILILCQILLKCMIQILSAHFLP